MTPSSEQVPTLPIDPDSGPSARATSAFLLTVFGLFGVVALVVAVVIGTGGSDGSKTATAGDAVSVTLTEFAISPGAINAVNGPGLHVTNNGNVQHNLAVEGTTFATAMIEPGQSAHLDLSMLAPGDYTVICQVPGHKEAGMKATLHLTAGQGTVNAAAANTPIDSMDMSSSSSSMSPEQMDQAMKDSITAFPAVTEGLGAQTLAPTVLPDGTKQFDLTTAITNWEVSPGKTVQGEDVQRHGPGPDDQGRTRRPGADRPAQQAARVDLRSTSTASRCRTRWTASPTSPRTR